MNKTAEVSELNDFENEIKKFNLQDVQTELQETIERVKANSYFMPFLRDQVEICMRIPNSIYKYKDKFSFAYLRRASGFLQIIGGWCAGLEKRDSNAPICLEVHLYPYSRDGGRLLMAKTLKYMAAPAAAGNGFYEHAKALGHKEESKIQEQINGYSGKYLDVFSNPEFRAEDIPMSEVYCNGFKPMPKLCEVPLVEASVQDGRGKAYYDVYDNTALVSVEGPQTTQGQLTASPIKEKTEIKIVEQLVAEDFLNAPIDFDYKKWGLWSKDGTRGVIKRTFHEHDINTPADLMMFLGTNDPTNIEWDNFIYRLNKHNSHVKLAVGAHSKLSLLKWMRKYKLIPGEFRSNFTRS